MSVGSFDAFPVGTIFNSIPTIKKCSRVKECITIRFPSRLNAMAIDPGKVTVNNNLIYKAGEVVFAISLFRQVTVRVIRGQEDIIVTNNSPRHSIIRHAALLMKKVMCFTESLEIDIVSEFEAEHCGLGSSSAIISSVAVAINELYGNPIPPATLVRYLAQNHGEEIWGIDNKLMPVQCLGGAAAAGIFPGGVLIIAGESTVIAQMEVPEKYEVVIAIPNDYIKTDAKDGLEKEIMFFPKFLETGNKYAATIAYRLLHDCLPSLYLNDMRPLGDLIYDYRFKMGSIPNCSFLYPKIVEKSERVKELKENMIAEILSLSSVGPAMFAITKFPEKCEEVFRSEGFNTIRTVIFNGTYEILK